MTKITFISDTHNKHGELTPQIIAAKPDVLVHCGDSTNSGWGIAPNNAKEVLELSSVIEWCDMLLGKEYVGAVIMIAGNHEITLQSSYEQSVRSKERMALCGIHYLEDSGVTLDGVSFYGSPWTPQCGPWGFQIENKWQAEAIWKKIPEHLDVLITHGPPAGILDKTEDGIRVGCDHLRVHLAAQTKYNLAPRIHAFGHIHHSYGMQLQGRTLHINACTTKEFGKSRNPPISIIL